MILVEAKLNRMGDLVIEPVNERVRRRYAAHMHDMTGSADSSVYIQGDGKVEEALEHMPARHRSHLKRGYAVRFKMDPWDFGHMLGYDAHEVRV